MKTIKQSNCPGLSGTNTISYEVGLKPDQSQWLRLTKSSGGGLFSNDWVSMATVIDALRQAQAPFTSYALHKLFEGKSVNTPGFLMAVLRHEGLVTPDKKKQQAFTISDLEADLGKPLAKAATTPASKKRPPHSPK